MKKIRSMVNSYKIDAISIVTVPHLARQSFIKKIAFDKPIHFYCFRAGASVYSASKIARRVPKLWCNCSWFGFYRETVRSFGWIGLKIDPKAIEIWLNRRPLLNSVGININTASKHLLSYVSGIGEKLAENIVLYRSENGPFENSSWKKVPRLGEKAYQQGRFHSHFEC
jgi:uncharacterized protein